VRKNKGWSDDDVINQMRREKDQITKDLYLTQTSGHEQRLWAIIMKLTMTHGEHVMGG